MVVSSNQENRNLQRWIDHGVPTQSIPVIPLASDLPRFTSVLQDTHGEAVRVFLPHSLPSTQVMYPGPANFQEESHLGVPTRSLRERVCITISDVGSYMSRLFQGVVTSISDTYTDDQLEALNNWSVHYPYGAY